MLKTIVPFDQVGQLSKTDQAYATGDASLMPFYKYELNHEAFRRIIEDKNKDFIDRDLLVNALLQQYAKLPDNQDIIKNIEALRSPNTFTVITAHQPCLFLGPLYFIYKAISTINLAGAASGLVSGHYRIVPVFVLGSEDHDLEEINHATVFGKKIIWEPEVGGAVGSISTESMQDVLEQCKAILGNSENAQQIFAILQSAYNGTNTFAEATQALLHALLGKYGLIVLNMNDRALKSAFVPIMRAELTEQVAYRIVGETTKKLNELGFKTQAAPRAINLFYMLPGLRERIVFEENQYKVLNTTFIFSKAEMLYELENHPERFSPNVVLRPLFQEMILPNLAYVGGGGELAYWLERKSLFEHFNINFPLLVRRNSVLMIDREQAKKMQRYGISSAKIFNDADQLVRNFIEMNAATEVTLNTEVADLQKIFDRIAYKAKILDPTLENAVQADAHRFVQALNQWENRLLRAEKAKHEVTISQIRALKNRLFPNGGLQERSENFLAWYLKYGENFFVELIEKLLPLERGVVVLEEKY